MGESELQLDLQPTTSYSHSSHPATDDKGRGIRNPMVSPGELDTHGLRLVRGRAASATHGYENRRSRRLYYAGPEVAERCRRGRGRGGDV
ncbi:uncharacterized protein L3040_008744 [Drepanopeziza brunnea f. sp. 'multigermtubi']|uniref:uncharacterized protein n=1 Tax=Drepanopeziza brunnea f. sp. 'multigermtubi' TaxID=698441 RepID=UPI002389AFE5|nr:hypothetical protein L3040_008744 [Drepanopeziza brunnea f. sp. 'multigermtubi']